MTRPSESPPDAESAAGCLIALVVLVGVVLVIATTAGVDLARFVPEPSSLASSAPGRVNARTPSPGRVVVPAHTNRPGVPIRPPTMRFLERVAEIYGGTIIASSGSGGDHGPRSDHYSGHAVDFGMPTNGSYASSSLGDRIMQACLMAAGYPSARARRIAEAGGLETTLHDGLRIQCIWKVAGHFSHVHIGARPTG